MKSKNECWQNINKKGKKALRKDEGLKIPGRNKKKKGKDVATNNKIIKCRYKKDGNI
jgi:hypothetical protein